MLEAYWAFADFEKMADLVEGMICHLAEIVLRRPQARSTRTKKANVIEDHQPRPPLASSRATRTCSTSVDPTMVGLHAGAAQGTRQGTRRRDRREL